MQETCAKCFAVHILKFENLQITWKKWNNEYQTLSFQFFTNKFSILMSSFFHVVCNISTFDKWTEKHLAQASCIEFILAYLLIFYCPERAQLHTLGHISDTRKPLRPYIMVMYMPYFSRPLAKLNWRNG